MDVHGRLVASVAGAQSPAGALGAAARIIAESLSAGACTIFVRRAEDELDRHTHFGPELEPAAAAAGKTLAEKTLRDVLPARGATPTMTLVAVPIASVNHVVGAIVVWRSAPASFTAEEIMRLSGVASQIVELIESARLIETIDAGATESALPEPPPPTGERLLSGHAASPGVAIGVVTFRYAFPRAIARGESVYRGARAEAARARDAFEKARNDLVRLQAAAASEIGEEHALIFGAHLLLLNDPMFTGLVDHGILASHPAAVSVEDAFDEIVRRLRLARDPYVQERIEDIEDLRARVLGYLVGGESAGELGARLVVSSRTTPSLVLELKARGALGIASELGTATSHGVLLARALGVPAVTGIEGLTRQVLAGDVLVVDGDHGAVVVRPTAETKAKYARRAQEAERRRTEFLRYRDRPASTADGERFELQANVALGADLDIARENHADGIGLYRTEFPFIVRDGLPPIEEQVRIYSKAYDAFPDGPVTFRLLDLAGDKFLPSRGLGVARDAFHGYRSIRILFDYPHVLRDQVQAFAIAAAGRPIRLLIPMVTSLEDVQRIKALVASALAQASPPCKDAPLTFGAMIETPAAVEITRDLAREVDFFSIGTNDLIQYTLVVDREDPRLSSERHAYHPAILRMIYRVVAQAHGAGKRVAVCGEMASRPELAIALLAMGIDALSMVPRAIPELKQALARMRLDPLKKAIEGLIAAPTGDDIERALRRYAREGTP